MIFNIKWFYILVTVIITSTRCHLSPHDMCGCRVMRSCYARMLNELREQDEARCLEQVEMGTSTVMMYLTALTKYCGHLINVTKDNVTLESRYLYEVHLHAENKEEDVDFYDLPLILIEAGQDAGIEPVNTAMRFIEHLMACEEHESLLKTFRWVILPSVNPDGLEYVRFDRPEWRKNTRKTGGGSHGVDITRNFNIHWEQCPKNLNGFSRWYPGPEPDSEAETKFIKAVIMKHKRYIAAYLSLKRNGHGILYPHGYTKKTDGIPKRTIETADLVSQRVNQRGSSRQTFLNSSIYDWKGEAMCGNSVDYVFGLGIELAYEMRVGHGHELEIIQKLQKFDTEGQSHRQLLSSYFSGIRYLCSLIAEHIGAESTKKKRKIKIKKN